MDRNQSKSSQIAIGGVFSGLCLVIMFLTGLIPFGTYVFPALAGAMLVAVVVENGNKVALMVYVSVSFLSVFIVPDREAAMMFVFLFGYYPVAKSKIEQLPLKVLQIIIKLLLFITSVGGAYYLMIHLLGMPDLIEEFGTFGTYGAYILLGIGALSFLLYDMTLTKYTQIYIHYFRKKLGRH